GGGGIDRARGEERPKERHGGWPRLPRAGPRSWSTARPRPFRSMAIRATALEKHPRVSSLIDSGGRIANGARRREGRYWSNAADLTMEPVKQCVARMARSDIRERWCGFLGCSRISLALNAGYKLGPR